MIEVHSGARPGRPVLLLIISAIVLCVTLGLARLQVATKRALGAAISLPNSPLVIRPPQEWSADEKVPNRFVQSSGARGLFSEWEDQRSIEFHYETLYPGVTARAAAQILISEVTEFLPNARKVNVGPWGGLEIQRTGALIRDNVAARRTEICRLAVSPRGDVLLVRYECFGTPTLGDLTRLDDICDAIKFEKEARYAIDQSAAEALLHFQFGKMDDWEFLHQFRPESLGVILSRETADERTTINFLRTWRSFDRDPIAILCDRAAIRLRVPYDTLQVQELVSSNDSLIAYIESDPSERDPDTNTAFSILANGEQLALIDITTSAPLDDTGGFLQDVFGEAQLQPVPRFANLDAATEVGRQVIADVRETGIAQSLPTSDHEQIFASSGALIREEIERVRRSRSTRNVWQHAGEETRIVYAPIFRGPQELSSEQWVTDDTATIFKLNGEQPIQRPTFVFSEERKTVSGPVIRQILSGRKRETSFDPGPNYAAPPLLPYVYASFANGNEPQLLVEVSAIRAAATNALLATVLERTIGQTQLFLQTDSRPTGMIYVIDNETGEIREMIEGATRFKLIADR